MPKNLAIPLGELLELPEHSYAAMFPLLSTTQAHSLACDIQRNGLLTPLDVYEDAEGKRCLLDGRNRLRALAEGSSDLNIEVPCEVRFPADFHAQTIEEFIAQRNMQRRHLSKSQLAMHVAQALLSEQGASDG